MRTIFCGALPWPATLNHGFQRRGLVDDRQAADVVLKHVTRRLKHCRWPSWQSSNLFESIRRQSRCAQVLIWLKSYAGRFFRISRALLATGSDVVRQQELRLRTLYSDAPKA